MPDAEVEWPTRGDDDYEDWKYEVSTGATLRGFADWRAVNRLGLD